LLFQGDENMTRNDENPARGGASVHALRPGSRSSNSTAAPTAQPQKIEISEQGAAFIDSLSNGLAARDLELWQLPDCLHWFYVRAWIEGRDSRNDEIGRLNFEADYWYWRHANPRADFYRHAESELWRQGVAA
jgi:hypothetical protein